MAEALKEEFSLFASLSDDNGRKYMTESDLMQAFGVGAGSEMYDKAKKGADGLVSLEEYMVLAATHHAPTSSLREAFKVFDKDGDGQISLQDFMQVIKHVTALDIEASSPSPSSDHSSQGHPHTTGLISKYFGPDGDKRVTFNQFGAMLRELSNKVVDAKWRSLQPAPDGTVSLVSFGRLLVKTTQELPPVLAQNLVSPDNMAVRLSYADFRTFYEVLDNLGELQGRLEKAMASSGTLSKEAFDRTVRSVASRRVVYYRPPSTNKVQGTSAQGSGTVAMDILFSWLDTNNNGTLDREEVRALMTKLQETSALPPRKLHLWENVVLGGTSAAIAGTLVFPMDTIKTRLMNGQGTTIMGTLRNVIQTQGTSALFRGLPAQLVGIMPEKALKLTLYNNLRQMQMDPKTQKVPYTAEALAGLGTACVQVCVTQPYELVKLRQQTVAGQSLGDTMKELGLKGLTRGTSATLLRDIPFNAMYFSSYAMLKDWLHETYDPPGKPLISPEGLMMAGLGAGLFAGALTTPADVIKTRMQADKEGRYKGMMDCIRQMWAEGGPRAFMRGLGPRIALIPPMFAITMTCFETFQRWWFPATVPGKIVEPWHTNLRHNSAEAVRGKLAKMEALLAQTSTSSRT